MSVVTGRRVYIAGHSGLVGSALVRALERSGAHEVITVGHEFLDLREQGATREFMAATQPDLVIVAAGLVGGILANSTRPAEFLYDNLMIHANVLAAAHGVGVEKLLYLGSSCIYPRLATQPITEDELLAGPLEPTNEAYAIAKIAGIKLCDAYRAQYGANFISAMPTNLYGPGDRFDLDGGHVLPSLMLKFHQAKVQEASEVHVWGTGRPMREFLHVDDLAAACLHLLDTFDGSGPVNVGSGQEFTIEQVAHRLRDLICPEVEIVFDPSMPDGTPRKALDSSRLAELGWEASIDFDEGLRSTYAWFLEHHAG